MAIKMRYKPQKMLKLKVFFSIILAILLIVQICSLVSISQAMSVDYRNITVADMDSLKDGELVQGTVSGSDVILKYQDATIAGSMVECFAVRTGSGKIIVLSGNAENAPKSAKSMAGFNAGGDDSMAFRGKVGSLTFTYRDSLLMNMTLNNTYVKHSVDAKDVTWTAISLLDNDSSRWTALLVASIISVLALLAGLWFLLGKSINNIIYGLLVQKGVIEPELKVTKNDIVLENMDNYRSPENDIDSFYVNDDFDSGDVGEGYKFSADREEIEELKGLKNDMSGMNYKRPADSDTSSADEKNENEIRNILASNKFLASTGIFGLVGHELEKKEYKPEDIEFYQGGVNEDGYFYVDSKKDENDDFAGDNMRKY